MEISKFDDHGSSTIMEIAQLRLGTTWSRQFVTLRLSWVVFSAPIRYEWIMEVTNPNFVFYFCFFGLPTLFHRCPVIFVSHFSENWEMEVTLSHSLSNGVQGFSRRDQANRWSKAWYLWSPQEGSISLSFYSIQFDSILSLLRFNVRCFLFDLLRFTESITLSKLNHADSISIWSNWSILMQNQIIRKLLGFFFLIQILIESDLSITALLVWISEACENQFEFAAFSYSDCVDEWILILYFALDSRTISLSIAELLRDCWYMC